jgi:hypothetical protein
MDDHPLDVWSDNKGSHEHQRYGEAAESNEFPKKAASAQNDSEPIILWELDKTTPVRPADCCDDFEWSGMRAPVRSLGVRIVGAESG